MYIFFLIKHVTLYSILFIFFLYNWIIKCEERACLLLLYIPVHTKYITW